MKKLQVSNQSPLLSELHRKYQFTGVGPQESVPISQQASARRKEKGQRLPCNSSKSSTCAVSF